MANLPDLPGPTERLRMEAMRHRAAGIMDAYDDFSTIIDVRHQLTEQIAFALDTALIDGAAMAAEANGARK